MKKYEIEYRDCTGMLCSVEVEALHEKEAITNYQQELIENGDYMLQLIDIQEVNEDCQCGDCKPVWSTEDGTELDQEFQDTLNEAFNSFVNEDGLTMKEVIDNK
tara:strand:+ start:331 stop:642 length:312 start_codon:yes stop_codon:yes gene_type:complete